MCALEPGVYSLRGAIVSGVEADSKSLVGRFSIKKALATPVNGTRKGAFVYAPLDGGAGELRNFANLG